MKLFYLGYLIYSSAICAILRVQITNSTDEPTQGRTFKLTVFSTITFTPFAIRQKSHPPGSLPRSTPLLSRSLSVPRTSSLSRTALSFLSFSLPPFIYYSFFSTVCAAARRARASLHTRKHTPGWSELALRGARRGHLFVTGTTGTRLACSR